MHIQTPAYEPRCSMSSSLPTPRAAVGEGEIVLRHHWLVLVLWANLRFLLYGYHLGQGGKDQEVRQRELFCFQLLISQQENILELGCQNVSAKGSWKKQSQVLILPNAQQFWSSLPGIN